MSKSAKKEVDRRFLIFLVASTGERRQLHVAYVIIMRETLHPRVHRLVFHLRVRGLSPEFGSAVRYVRVVCSVSQPRLFPRKTTLMTALGPPTLRRAPRTRHREHTRRFPIANVRSFPFARLIDRSRSDNDAGSWIIVSANCSSFTFVHVGDWRLPYENRICLSPLQNARCSFLAGDPRYEYEMK